MWCLLIAPAVHPTQLYYLLQSSAVSLPRWAHHLTPHWLSCSIISGVTSVIDTIAGTVKNSPLPHNTYVALLEYSTNTTWTLQALWPSLFSLPLSINLWNTTLALGLIVTAGQLLCLSNWAGVTCEFDLGQTFNQPHCHHLLPYSLHSPINATGFQMKLKLFCCRESDMKCWHLAGSLVECHGYRNRQNHWSICFLSQ